MTGPQKNAHILPIRPQNTKNRGWRVFPAVRFQSRMLPKRVKVYTGRMSPLQKPKLSSSHPCSSATTKTKSQNQLCFFRRGCKKP